MPIKPARPCAVCGALTLNKERFCDLHLKIRQQEADAKRGTSAERGYDYRWQQARNVYLQQHPLCVVCKSLGYIVPATEVHHIKPLISGGDNEESNLISLCKSCHSKITIRESGYNASNWRY